MSFNTNRLVLERRLSDLTAINTLRIIGELSEKIGVKTYLVGGAVRDTIIGKKNKDLDFVSSNSEKITNAIATYVKSKTGKKPKIAFHETKLTRIMRAFGQELEFVDPRKESYYKDSIKPIVHKVKSFKEDALRRDFTLNALYINILPKNWMEIIDLTGKGLTDLRNGTLRTPLNPRITFSDDPTRLLRLARFSACKIFKIEITTLRSAKSTSKQIKRVPAELQKKELDRGILCNNYLYVLNEIGLIDEIFPELTNLKNLKQPKEHHKYDAFKHTIEVVGFLPKKYLLRWAGLFHDLGKYPMYKSTGQFYNHDKYSEEMAVKIMKRLKFSNTEIRYVRKVVKNHHRVLNLINSKYSDKAIRRLLVEYADIYNDLILFAEADVKSAGVHTRGDLIKIGKLKTDIKRVKTKLVKETGESFTLAVNGNDIIKILKLKKGGKIVGIILKDIKDQVIDQKIKNNKQVLTNYILKKYKNRM